MSESGQKVRQNRAMGLRRRIAVASTCALAICSTALWMSLSSASGATSSALTTKTFLFTNGEQIFKVPDGVTAITVTAVGGKGANGGGGGNAAGGFGASATAAFNVTPGQILFVNVGGNGSGSTAGFNGGGSGGNNGSAFVGGGGGGGTDIRTNSRAQVGNTLVTRLIIAGGGGGGGGGRGDTGLSGGPAGFAGSSSIVPAGSGTGGTSGGGSAGGLAGSGASRTAGGGPAGLAGTFGSGGNGQASNTGVNGGGGGGGGGGKFGGGGAVNGSGGDSAGGGGGGGSTDFGDTAKNPSFGPDNTGVPQVRITYNTTGGGGNNNGLKFGKVIKNKKKGTALLPVTVPGSGTLSIGGKGVVKKRPALARALRLLKDAPEAGTYKLKVKAKGNKLNKLDDTGKVKVKAVVTFEPTSGDAVSASKKIKLKEN
jgi:hypothetical protein